MRLPPETYTRDEVDQILLACTQSPVGARSCVLEGHRLAGAIALAYASGLRCAELMELKPADINRERSIVQVRHGKGDRWRWAPVRAIAWPHLDAWYDIREREILEKRKHLSPAHTPMFCLRNGNQLRGDSVRQMLARLRDRMSFAKRLHMHGFRHSFATELAYANVGLPVLQVAMGHASLLTTNAYIRRIAPVAMVEAVIALDNV